MDKQKFKYWVKGIAVIRLIAWPVENIRQYWIKQQYLKSGEDLYIKTLKNRHQGERCFVIGNGPSLTAEDLNKLTEEITFASNRIFCIYPETEWRPTYYISVDPYAFQDSIEVIKKAGSYEKFINYTAKKYKRKESENLHYIYLKGQMPVKRGKDKVNDLSEDVSLHFTRNGTVTVNAIELAIYMGFQEIYLLGVDNNYALKQDKKGHIYKDEEVKSSYFEGMKYNEFHAQSVDYMNRSYLVSKRFAEEKGANIYNATRGGKLEVFERVDFDELMSRKGDCN